MVYITGDTHGQFDKIYDFVKKYQLTNKDKIIILGDVGLNYYGDKTDLKNKQKLNDLGVIVLCVHGNHENRADNLKTSKYTSSLNLDCPTIYEEDFPNIHYLVNGYSYNIEGKNCFVMGGAYSVDKDYRLRHGLKWWIDEQPRFVDKKRASNTIELNQKYDVVLTHTCPLKYIPTEVFLPFIDQSTVDNSTEKYLQTLESALEYGLWFCGHYHTDKKIDKMRFLFDDFFML